MCGSSCGPSPTARSTPNYAAHGCPPTPPARAQLRLLHHHHGPGGAGPGARADGTRPRPRCSSRPSCRSTRSCAPSNSVTNIELSLDTPNVFSYSHDVGLTFDYSTSEPGGVRDFRPPLQRRQPLGLRRPRLAALPGGARASTGCSASPQAHHSGQDPHSDVNDAQTTLLYEAFLPVSLQAGAGPPWPRHGGERDRGHPGHPGSGIRRGPGGSAVHLRARPRELAGEHRRRLRHPERPARLPHPHTGAEPGQPRRRHHVRTSLNREQLNEELLVRAASGWTGGQPDASPPGSTRSTPRTIWRRATTCAR